MAEPGINLQPAQALAEETNQIGSRGIDPKDLATARRVLLTLIGNLAQDDIDAAPGTAQTNG